MSKKSIRYEEATDEFVKIFFDLVEERFPEYQRFNFKLIFDTKKRVRNNQLSLATIELTSDKIKFFSKDDIVVDGYDYVMIIDKKAWEISSTENKKRMISHELRHVFIDPDTRKPKLTGHDVEDFRAEVELNQDEPGWREHLTQAVMIEYGMDDEAKKEKVENKKMKYISKRTMDSL